MCGYLPFEDPNTAKLYKKIVAGQYEIPKFISEQGWDFLSNILQIDPMLRYGLKDIQVHPWFNQINYQNPSGILVGIDQIPLDSFILNELYKQGFD